MLIDGQELREDVIECGVCIVGAGPAGISLAAKLAASGMDVVVVESGGRFAQPEVNQLNRFRAESNFVFRRNFANRHRQIGGSTNLWPGRIVRFRFISGLDSEWGELSGILPRYYGEADRLLGVPPELRRTFPDEGPLLSAYWAPVTQRFNCKSELVRNAAYRLVYHLSFSGEAEFRDSRIVEMVMRNHAGGKVRIRAGEYVLATGGIENTRLLLLMGDDLRRRMGKARHNVGAFVMDHPKITEGRLRLRKRHPEFRKYRLRVSKWGKVKYGIRNEPEAARIYCNLVESRSKRVQRMYARMAERFKRATGRVLQNERGRQGTDLIEDLIYLLEPREVIPHWLSRATEGLSIPRTTGRYKVVTYLEQRPRRENAISLDPDRHDALGRPLPLITSRVSGEELREVGRFYEGLEGRFSRDGMEFRYDRDRILDAGNFTEASHHLGGTRYSAEAERAVVDRDLRVLGVDNLRLAGSSVFPTGGVENPTHLIVALSCHLADVMKGGGS